MNPLGKSAGCELFQNIMDKFSQTPNGIDFADRNFLHMDGHFVKGAELMGLDGCEMRRKLGWSQACSCPEYNQRFMLVDEDTEEPITNFYYEIKSESSVLISGKTDDKGYTEKFHAHQEEEIKLKVFAE
jgi:hypothetical protein